MKDTIYRQDAINLVHKSYDEILDFSSDGHTIAGSVEDIINMVPPAEPDWIPVTDRLPEEEIDVLVCNTNGDIEISSGSYSTEVRDFIWYTSGWRFGKVIAWMPKPKPYKAESEK